MATVRGRNFKRCIQIIDRERNPVHSNFVGAGRWCFDCFGVEVLEELQPAVPVRGLQHRNVDVVPVQADGGVSPLAADRVPAKNRESEVGEEGNRCFEVADCDPYVLESNGHGRYGSEGTLSGRIVAMKPEILHLTAFASTPDGGNPAGVVLDASSLSTDQMQRIAAEVGYAESAFVTRSGTAGEPGRIGVRYFSPVAEVPFCGHATVATAVALAERGVADNFVFETAAGEVPIRTSASPAGIMASFTSVEPMVTPMDPDVLDRLLRLLGLAQADLHGTYPARLSFAGNTHPVIVLGETAVFDRFTFDPAAVRALMDEQGWKGTVTVLAVHSPTEFEARNLFPVGAITEDPATGSAAASVGAYLRELGLAEVPGQILIHQGRHVGRPSLLTVDIPAAGGIRVSGTATEIEQPRPA